MIYLIFLSACASNVPPSEEALLTQARWSDDELVGSSFEHHFFVENLRRDIASLHIYIGGDGRAFLNRNSVSQDPTPSEHLALQLALDDASPSGFLSRP